MKGLHSKMHKYSTLFYIELLLRLHLNILFLHFENKCQKTQTCFVNSVKSNHSSVTDTK